MKTCLMACLEYKAFIISEDGNYVHKSQVLPLNRKKSTNLVAKIPYAYNLIANRSHQYRVTNSNGKSSAKIKRAPYYIQVPSLAKSSSFH